ncbi:hypothetical protein ZIOFF_024622 [Zingiber officinale]|uniref:AT-hook motif nuclear-localized protein n=1 Tax=Zingiber officinale TaxID=94328 RepID=A0A8J5L6D0_ZINOF|nr:hypothetical protein ZIOFF_024622 [Zingiber officinale]
MFFSCFDQLGIVILYLNCWILIIYYANIRYTDQDIATKIMSFSQQGPRVVCILSANGVVSTVTLRQSTSSGGTVTYEVQNSLLPYFLNCYMVELFRTFIFTELMLLKLVQGRFQILCLSGLYMRTDNGGSRSRTGGLSVCLSSPDGQIIGGGVAGVLIAATPVQVIVGSFIYTRSKTKNKAKASRNETNPEAERPAPYAALPNPNLTPSPIIGAWPRSRHLDMRNAHIDIDLMQG